MKTIAIDTSHAAGTVAVCDGRAWSERRLGATGEHARLLAAALAEATAELGWTPADADLVAVVRGPGSFTGLRVGVATAKAVAWAGGAGLVGVSGFEVIAREVGRTTGWRAGPLAIAYDAGRGEVFVATAVTDHTGTWLITAGELAASDAWIASLPPGSRLAGPALGTLAGRLTAAGHILAPPAAWLPTAAAAGELAIAKFTAGLLDSPAGLVPEYLRPSYADERAGPAGSPRT